MRGRDQATRFSRLKGDQDGVSLSQTCQKNINGFSCNMVLLNHVSTLIDDDPWGLEMTATIGQINKPGCQQQLLCPMALFICILLDHWKICEENNNIQCIFFSQAAVKTQKFAFKINYRSKFS